jgi:hypothetical protein
MNVELSRRSFEKYSNTVYQDNPPVEAEVFHADGRTPQRDLYHNKPYTDVIEHVTSSVKKIQTYNKF